MKKHYSNNSILSLRDAPQILCNVFEKIINGCCDEFILDFGDCFLRLQVAINTDAIIDKFSSASFNKTKEYVKINNKNPWKKHIKRECSWTWRATNQQGYIDCFLISFEGVVPNILLLCIASSIKIFVVNVPIN